MQHTLRDDLAQRIHLTHVPALDQPFCIDRAGGVVAEAVVERMFEMVHVEIVRTAFIGPIQERTMVLVFSHAATLTPWRVFKVIGWFGLKT
jgi:hypothetical protein